MKQQAFFQLESSTSRKTDYKYRSISGTCMVHINTVIHRKLGKGTVTYAGTDTDDGKLEKDVLQKIYQQAGVQTLNLPEGIIVQYNDGFWYGLNYSSQKQEISIPASATILIGQKSLNPAEVVIWQEK